MDKVDYTRKCLEHLTTTNFKKLAVDVTKTIETKVQNSLVQIKENIGESLYKEIYPSGSSPGKFYGTAKVHKIKDGENLDITNIHKLPIRPIVSNIGTATYRMAKYLSKLLAPLSNIA